MTSDELLKEADELEQRAAEHLMALNNVPPFLSSDAQCYRNIVSCVVQAAVIRMMNTPLADLPIGDRVEGTTSERLAEQIWDEPAAWLKETPP